MQDFLPTLTQKLVNLESNLSEYTFPCSLIRYGQRFPSFLDDLVIID